MTREEAITAMKNGEKVTHGYFSDDEWMTMKDGDIVTEDGYKHNEVEFWAYRQIEAWNDGYEIFYP